MSKNRKPNSKSSKADRTYNVLSDAPLQAIAEEEAAFLSSLSAEELNALIEGRTEVKRGV